MTLLFPPPGLLFRMSQNSLTSSSIAPSVKPIDALNVPRIRIIRGTLRASMGFTLGAMGMGGSPSFFLEMDGNESFSEQLSSAEAVDFGVANYEPLNDLIGTVSSKRPMKNSTVVLQRQTGKDGRSDFEVLAIDAGEEIPKETE